MKKYVICITLCLILAIATCLSGCVPATVEKDSTPKPADETAQATPEAEETPETETTPEAEDTPVPEESPDDRTVSFYGVKFTLPEGFKETNQNGVVTYVPEDYPAHSDSINTVFSSVDIDAGTISRENIEEPLKSALGIEGLSSFDVTKAEIGGKDSEIIFYSFVFNSVELEMEQLILHPGNGAVTITISTVSGEYKEAFEAFKSSIVFE